MRASFSLVTGLALALLAALAAPAAASDWGGFNGVVHLSFSDGDTLTPVLDLDAEEGELVIVDLYAVLDGVVPVSYQGEGFLSIGGFELTLEVDGPGEIIGQKLPGRAINLYSEPGHCQVGIYPSLDIVDGRATLVHWRVMYQGRPGPTAFRLAEAGAPSCDTVEGCAGTGTRAMYAGSDNANLAGLLFSAGWTPAYLNWEGEADTSVQDEGTSWSERGIFD